MTRGDVQRVVFRPEKPKIALYGVLLAIAVYAIVSLFALARGSDLNDPVTWLVAIGLIGVAGLAIRGMTLRVIADDDGVQIVNLFRRLHYKWGDIDRFDITSWLHYACLVTNDGGRHRFGMQSKSEVEQLTGKKTHTDDVLASLSEFQARMRPPVA